MPISPPLMTDELPLRIEAEELVGGQQLIISEELAVRGLLAELAGQQQPACLYIDSGDSFALSAIRGIEAGRLVLAIPEGPMQQSVANAAHLTVVVAVQRVKMQFEVDNSGVGKWRDDTCLFTDLPKYVLRLQRRDSYRLTALMGAPLSCYIPLSTKYGDEAEISVVDISIGGVGILGYVPGLRFAPGERFNAVRVELPGVGTAMGDIEIRSSRDTTLRNGIRTVRTGARFINLNGTMQAMIQRYISQAERARLAD